MSVGVCYGRCGRRTWQSSTRFRLLWSCADDEFQCHGVVTGDYYAVVSDVVNDELHRPISPPVRVAVDPRVGYGRSTVQDVDAGAEGEERSETEPRF